MYNLRYYTLNSIKIAAPKKTCLKFLLVSLKYSINVSNSFRYSTNVRFNKVFNVKISRSNAKMTYITGVHTRGLNYVLVIQMGKR